MSHFKGESSKDGGRGVLARLRNDSRSFCPAQPEDEWMSAAGEGGAILCAPDDVQEINII